MCGIFGWFGSAPKEPAVFSKTLIRLLRHRGPDDQGFEYDTGWGLGFRRLSILDLSEFGHQPMCTPDGRYWIVFNGEIYNYLELREKLEQQGEQFQSISDTEVLLRLLAREGFRALEQLNGMFALALVDTAERTYLLARDRLGQKPLYYHLSGEGLRFASELKALLAWPNAPRQINYQAVVQYLAMSYLPNETCIFENYQKLPPGNFLAGSLDEPKQAKLSAYWHVELNDETGSGVFTEKDLEELLDLLGNATQIRLRSDVPVGIFLSGGIDSGLVAALAGQSKTGTRPLALTISFDEEEYNERPLAEATASHIGLEHRIIPQQHCGLSDIDRLAWFYDEPFGDSSALPTMTLCKAASEHATVFLSGDGGDEAFAGYKRYIKARRYSWLGKLPAPARLAIRWLSHCFPLVSSLRYRLLKSSLPDTGLAAVMDDQGLGEDPALESILHADLKNFAITGGAPVWKRWAVSRGQKILSRQQALDYSLYLPDDILVKVDRASMAHSIEVRSPLLDYRLVEWAARLPRETLLDSNTGKLPLRAVGKSLLPHSVNHSSKFGFGVPLNAWFRHPAGQNFARERLLSAESKRYNFWDLKGVENLLAAHQTGRGRNFGELLWRLLVLDAWARHYLHGTNFLEGVS